MSALLTSFAASLSAEQEQTLSTQSDLSLTLRPSLWSHLSSLLLPAERDEALRLIASPFTAENANLEEEVHALLEIASSVRHPQADAHLPFAISSSSSWSPSPVPPLPSLFGLSQRERLKDDIACFIAALREKASERGEGDVAKLWTPRSEREKAIVQLVETEKQLSSRSASRTSSAASYRASTTHSRPSSSTSVSSSSASNGGSSRPSSFSAALPAMANLSSLSIFTMDAVVARIRQAFEDEHAELVRDADFLRAYIEEQQQAAASDAVLDSLSATTAQPTEGELRALSAQLGEAVRKEEERDRTLRLLSAVPSKAAFAPRTSLTLAVPQQTKGEGEKAEERKSPVESAHSLLVAMDEMEASLYQPRPSSSSSNPPSTHPTAPEVCTVTEVHSSPHSSSPLKPSPLPSPPTPSAFTLRRTSVPSPSSPLSSSSARSPSSLCARASSLTPRKPSPHLPSLHAVKS